MRDQCFDAAKLLKRSASDPRLFNVQTMARLAAPREQVKFSSSVRNTNELFLLPDRARRQVYKVHMNQEIYQSKMQANATASTAAMA